MKCANQDPPSSTASDKHLQSSTSIIQPCSELSVVWSIFKPYGHKSFNITNEAKRYEWKGYGITVYVPDRCLSQNVTSARLDLKVCTFLNQQTIPLLGIDQDEISNFQPMSALYSVTVGEGRLCKPVILEIQHCLEPIESHEPVPQHTDELSVLRAQDENTSNLLVMLHLTKSIVVVKLLYLHWKRKHVTIKIFHAF